MTHGRVQTDEKELGKHEAIHLYMCSSLLSGDNYDPAQTLIMSGLVNCCWMPLHGVAKNFTHQSNTLVLRTSYWIFIHYIFNFFLNAEAFQNYSMEI